MPRGRAGAQTPTPRCGANSTWCPAPSQLAVLRQPVLPIMCFPASPEIHLKILTTLYHRLHQKSPATPLTSQDAPLSSENGQRPQSSPCREFQRCRCGRMRHRWARHSDSSGRSLCTGHSENRGARRGSEEASGSRRCLRWNLKTCLPVDQQDSRGPGGEAQRGGSGCRKP